MNSVVSVAILYTIYGGHVVYHLIKSANGKS